MCHKKTDTAFFGAENFLSKFCSEKEVLIPKISVIIPAYNVEKFNLKEENFIGEINTMEYLSKNRDKILFVGGLGQVIIEGLFLNFPCLCCSNYKDKGFSFVTNKNFFLFDNFTVTKNIEKEFELKINDIKNYKLRHLIIANRNLTVSIGKYLSIIEN